MSTVVTTKCDGCGHVIEGAVFRVRVDRTAVVLEADVCGSTCGTGWMQAKESER